MNQGYEKRSLVLMRENELILSLTGQGFENLGSTPFFKLIISVPPQENCH